MALDAMKILALDLSSHTGWAIGSEDESPRYGTKHIKGVAKNLGPFAHEFDLWLRKTLGHEGGRPDRVVFEAPILARRSTVFIQRMLMGLAYHVELVCAELQIDCREADLQTIKHFWTGNGAADKAQMIRMAELYGFSPEDDNAADALALWHYAQQLAGARGKLALGPLGAVACRS